jgi:hypothetical protein
MRQLLLALPLALCCTPAPAQEGPAPALVYLADGTSFPLRSWIFSYEFVTWRQGTSPAFADSRRTDKNEVWLGKKTFAVAGTTLSIQYDLVDRERDVDGQTRKVKMPLARTLTLTTRDGKKTELKPEAPQRELLLPGGDKNLLLQPRSMDFKGESLTGTKREICLLSFTALVECQIEAGQQVVKIEFQ